MLEERLLQHDDNRKKIQSQLEEIHSKIYEEVDFFEEKVNKEERILNLIDQLNNINTGEEGEENDLESLVKQEEDELLHTQKYDIHIKEKAENFADSCELKTAKIRNAFTINNRNKLKPYLTDCENTLTTFMNVRLLRKIN